MLYNNISLHNVAEVIEENAAFRVARIPRQLETKMNDRVQIRMYWSSCVELRFVLHSGSAQITLSHTDKDTGPQLLELYQGAFFRHSHVLTPEPQTIEIHPPIRPEMLDHITQQFPSSFDNHVARVILPWRGITRIHAIEGDIAPPDASMLPEKRWLAYGSSITNGNNGVRPTGMYAMRAAQTLGVDLLNFGFGGGAHLEPEMADYIASRDDYDFASLEMGINMRGEFTVEQFRERVDYFVSTVANAHPDQWLFCLDMFPEYTSIWTSDEQQAKADTFRQIVRDKVAAIDRPRVVHIEAQPLLPDHTQLAADVLHPSPQGMESIGRNLAAALQSHLDGDVT